MLRSAVDGVKEDKEQDLTEFINDIKTFRASLQGE